MPSEPVPEPVGVPAVTSAAYSLPPRLQRNKYHGTTHLNFVFISASRVSYIRASNERLQSYRVYFQLLSIRAILIHRCVDVAVGLPKFIGSRTDELIIFGHTSR
jgi:hypothetical protein